MVSVAEEDWHIQPLELLDVTKLFDIVK